MPSPSPSTKSKSSFSFLLWWKVDPAELERQVAEYSTLTITKSARGVALLLCLFSVALTLVFGRWFGFDLSGSLLEAAIWLVIGTLMYRGHRWAFLAAMVLWTLEKAYSVVLGANTGHTPIVQLIFWAIYMNAFFLGFKIESARGQRAAEPLSAA